MNPLWTLLDEIVSIPYIREHWLDEWAINLWELSLIQEKTAHKRMVEIYKRREKK